MNRDELGKLALAIVLLFVAGWVDAIGFRRLGHLFVSFMSGDSTQLAVAAGLRTWDQAGLAGGIVALFVAGVVIGRLVTIWTRAWHRPAVLLLEAVLLGLALLIPGSGMAVTVPMMLAMGIQNAAIHRAGEAKASLTYVTGTLVNFGERLADAVCGAEPGKRWAWLPYLLFWAALVLGAAGGAVVYGWLQLRGLFVPVAILFALAAATAVPVRRGA